MPCVAFLRLGLRSIAAAGMTGLGFLLCQATLVVTGVLAPSVTEPIDTLASGLELVTERLLLAGMTIPVWGPMLADVLRWPADYRSYCRLRPLWLALQETGSEFRLLPADGRAWSPRDIGFLLYRQVTRSCVDGYYESRFSTSVSPVGWVEFRADLRGHV
jgi:hypothetical protein